MEEDLDEVALLVELADDGQLAGSFRFRAYNRPHFSVANGPAESIGVVTGIGDERLSARVGEELVGHDHLMPLPRRERDVDRAASIDEKTSIQALERTQLPLPLRTGRARRHTHDYKRHGVVDLYAALEIVTGKVTHRVSDSHTATDFLAFMNKVDREYPAQELHVILDNSSSHSTPEVKAWLAAHPRVEFHFTPTSASWLNQVEGFFGILGKQSLSETDFPSKKALREHLAAYMRSWNKNPTPFAWTKPANAIIKSHRRMLDRISTAVH